MELPKDEQDRKLLKEAIEEAVSIKLKQDGDKQAIKDIQSSVKDSLSISAREFNKRVKTRYLQLKAEEKYRIEKENAGVEFAENEILFGEE